MKTSSILAFTAAIMIVVAVLCIWLTPSQQDFTGSNVSWNGIRDWINSTSTIDANSVDNLANLAQNHVMLVIPNTPYQETEMARIKDFVSQGGSLVLLNDYGYGNDILSYCNVSARFTNKTVLDPLFCYKSPDLPRITDFNAALTQSGIKSVVLNHATSLSGVAVTDVLAWSSKDSFMDANNNGQYDAADSRGPLPVAARFTLGKGVITLFTDPSIMINSMLQIEDNAALVQYLTTSPDEQIRPILLDQTHIEQRALDKSKAGLYSLREFLAKPYSLLGLTAIIFVIVYHYGFKKGELVG